MLSYKKVVTTFFSLTVLFLAAMPLSWAAIQGKLDDESSGQILLRFTINPSYQISRVDDITLEISNFDKQVTYKERLCIRGPVNSQFSITAETEQPNAFAVASNTGATIPFQLYFYQTLNNQTPDRLQPGVRSQAYAVSATSQSCDGEDNSAVEILILPEHLKKAEVGEYNGVLILTVGSL
ncbi:MAG: hypothetical protein HRU20_26795 [Pseudomonadales bacterium]|nr:hypothetical protein [Pseudomonadales bacterium]